VGGRAVVPELDEPYARPGRVRVRYIGFSGFRNVRREVDDVLGLRDIQRIVPVGVLVGVEDGVVGPVVLVVVVVVIHGAQVHIVITVRVAHY